MKLGSIKAFLKRRLPTTFTGLLVGMALLGKLRFYRASRALQTSIRAVVLGGKGRPILLHALEVHLLSQYGEAGIIEGILQVIGRKSGRIIEFGFHPTEANCMNEALFCKAPSLFIDASSLSPKLARRAFWFLGRPNIITVSGFVTVENVNELFTNAGFTGEVDILSIDIDSNDYWIWKAVDVVSPRVVIMEYNDRLGPELPVTIRYDPDYSPIDASNGFYEGASLSALDRLAQAKGYRLIGVESAGVNAFFLRKDIQPPEFPTLSVAQAFRYNRRSLEQPLSDQQRRGHVEKFPFVTID